MNKLLEKVILHERKGIVSDKGEPLTLQGHEVKEGDKAPDFTVIDSDLNPIKLSHFQGKTIVISTIPSIDTPVCDRQTRRFAEEAKSIDPNVVILTISEDLPYAQKRWAKVHNIEGITFLSDHRETDFGLQYGLLIKERRELARAVLIIDKNGIVKYRQIVPELHTDLNYNDVLEHIGKLTSE